MRVAVDHLLAKLVHHVCDVIAAFLLGDLRIENNMKEHVAKFFLKSLGVFLKYCVTEFVDLFDSHRTKGVNSLCMVPWALSPEPVHHVQCPFERFQFLILILHNL